MTALEYTALGVSSLFFLVGLISSLLPVLPGSLVIWCGVVTHRLWMGADASVSWKLVILTLCLVLVGQLADFVLGVWGARRFGASWKGALGAFVGTIVALFIPPQIITLIVGPIIGAVMGELVAGRSFQEGGKAGMGTIIGSIIAFALKLGISITVISLFFCDLFLL